MWPDRAARPEFVEAFGQLAGRIAGSLTQVDPARLPVKMYVAGGAALHLYTGERVSSDVDAVFSHRIALPDALDISYRDADGAARLLYFDRQYSDMLALTHENAYEDSIAAALPHVDPRVLEVRLLAPLDLAVSKLSRFSEQSRADILTLARHRSLSSSALRQRATEALSGYVGNLEHIRGSIDLACRLVSDVERARP